MTTKEFLQSINDEVKTLLNPQFTVAVTTTTTVPNVEDQGFNLGFGEILKSKSIDTCVLFIDIRKSTQLNLKYKQEALARLYASFIKSMLKAAEHFGGKVRNINGDRVMVVFNSANCFTNAANTATLMSTISSNIIDKYFTQDDFKCGIEIAYGSMLVVKTGTIKQGDENQFYKSFVWLGKPANVASKLTDLANKDSVKKSVLAKLRQFNLSNLFPNPLPFGLAKPTSEPIYIDTEVEILIDSFTESISKDSLDSPVTHQGRLIYFWKKKEVKLNTQQILMTEEVYKGIVRESQQTGSNFPSLIHKNDNVVIDGYSGAIYGMRAYFPQVKELT